MVWDLRAALLKKGEMESARLMDFDFRLRARTFRLLGEAIDPNGEGAVEAVKLIAKSDDKGALAALANLFPTHEAELPALYERCGREARKQLIAERGDPTPHRLL